jgi:hypothetical protein
MKKINLRDITTQADNLAQQIADNILILLERHSEVTGRAGVGVLKVQTCKQMREMQLAETAQIFHVKKPKEVTCEGETGSAILTQKLSTLSS